MRQLARRTSVRRTTRAFAALLALVLTTTACSNAGPRDELQVVDDPVAAPPAVSPAPVSAPAGTVVPSQAVTAMATHQATRTLAIATDNPPAISLYSLDDLNQPSRQIPVPGAVERLTVADQYLLASVPTQNKVLQLALPQGSATEIPINGQPAVARSINQQTVVAVRDRKAVDVLSGNTVAKSISGELYSADDVLSTGKGTVVLDRLRTAVFAVDLEKGEVKEGLRAGQGATHATTDSFGRVLVVDTRAGALLAFSLNPLLLRQRYPVSGVPYGIAYDPARQLAWVTLTERNEVVGFDIRGGEPIERYRFPTVRQPNTVGVDDRTSRVIVGSAAGEGIQVVQP